MKYSLTKLLLNEYTDKLINQMISVYKPQTNDNEETIRQTIVRYGELIPSVEAKLKQDNPIVKSAVPDNLKQNNKFKDITSIKDYETLKRIKNAVEKKQTDPYAQAIEYFKRKDKYMDPSIIGMYVGQFKKIKSKLEKEVGEKNEIVINLIPKELIRNNKYNDILSYKEFSDLEKLIDGAFPIKGEGSGEINSAETDADKIYDNKSDGIEIYKGDNEHKCIKYGKNQYYSWCISRTKGSMYANYRFMQQQGLNRLFYFVVDRTQSDAKNSNGRFVNPYHAVVIHVNENNKYTRTTADNTGDEPYGGTDWNDLGKYFKGEDGQRMWNKIKNLQKYFTFEEPSSEERKLQGFKGQRININQFIDLNPEDKQAWLRANAGDRDIISSQIIKSLDNEQINDLINYNMKFSFDDLKKSQGLLKRYADYRFTRHQNDPLPYVFIPYLKPELQEKYFEKFGDDYTTFSIMEKYFNEDILKKYIDKELKQFGAGLPPEAKKYMTNEQRDLYDLYTLAFKDMTYNEDSVNKNSINAPEQIINLPSISQKSYKELKPEDRKKLNDLYKKLGSNVKNLQKYSNFFMGYPLTFEANGRTFLVAPSTKDSRQFVIMDEDGDTIKDNIEMITFSKGNDDLDIDAYTGKQHGNASASIKSNDYNKITVLDSSGDFKEISQNDISKYLQEALVNRYMMRQIKYRAGILK